MLRKVDIILALIVLVVMASKLAVADDLVGEQWLKTKIDRVYIVKPINGWVPWGRLIATAYWLPFKSLQSANNHIADWDHLKNVTLFIPNWQIPTDHVKKWQQWLSQFQSRKYQAWIAALVGSIRRQRTISVQNYLTADHRPSQRPYIRLAADQTYRRTIWRKPDPDLIAMFLAMFILVAWLIYLLACAYWPKRRLAVDHPVGPDQASPSYLIYYQRSTDNFQAINRFPHRPRTILAQTNPSIEELESEPY